MTAPDLRDHPADMDIAEYLLHPAAQALMLALFSSAMVLWHRPRAALAIGVVAVAWLWFASTPFLALRLREGLAIEAAPTRPGADAIVVLGGGRLPKTDWSQTATRAGMGLWLWRAGTAPVLLVSGSDQADDLARGYQLCGVPEHNLRIEDASRDTHENARNSAAILKAHGLDDIVLVTSAIHMRRAAACFRHEGLTVTPVPARDGSARLATMSAWWPKRAALTLTARCVHEYVALWVYRYRGWL